MTRNLIIASILILAALSGFAQVDTNFVQAHHYKSSKFNVAIFPANYQELLPSPRFSPTREEIDKAENRLPFAATLIGWQQCEVAIGSDLQIFRRSYQLQVASTERRESLRPSHWIDYPSA